MQHTQQSAWEKDENVMPNTKELPSQIPRSYSLMRIFFLLVGSIWVGGAIAFFLCTRPFLVNWSSGILCNSCIILQQCFWKTLSLSSSFLRKSWTILIKALKCSYASLAHPTHFFWPSLVRVHLASYFAAWGLVRGILIPAIYNENLVSAWILGKFTKGNFVLTLVFSLKFPVCLPLVTAVIVHHQAECFACCSTKEPVFSIPHFHCIWQIIVTVLIIPVLKANCNR